MHITLNNQSCTIPEGTSLYDLVSKHSGGLQNGIAVAVNHAVIPGTGLQQYILEDGDQILIIKATQGG